MSAYKENKDQELPYNPEITKDDQQALNEKGKSMNKGQDAALDHTQTNNDFAAKDLDIPGREDADTSSNGNDIPDEENRQFNKRGVKPDYQKEKEHPNSNKKI
ncbi:hypothetical protein [Zunongwangia sp. HGR-M22]|uniref:hypothetical protein n=1 Tax=Zunongwangia sp. HGR-M22 TaxID=3015168 RepID=UPI0022DDE595|nr:hypothetical protein [Zunongwangia sp. HGR-M22]WBL27193.1 hypothetical protein PBT91_07930 [Zunongwangia sp. HGR-M22]